MQTMRWRRTRRWAGVALLAALVFGCSGDDESGAADTATRAVNEDAPKAEAAEEPALGERETAQDQAGPGGATDQALPVAATLGRRVIRTATVELEDADPGAVAEEVTRVVERAGGFVAAADLRRDDDGVLSGSVTVRVPSERLETTLDELEGLADNAPVRRIEEEDVTTETADLEAQVRNLTAFETELRELLAEVESSSPAAEELLRVYERIREVRAKIDQIEGRLDVLGDRVSLATVTVRLTPTSQAVPVADSGWSPGETVRAALSATSRSLAVVADAAIWVGLTVVPVLAAIGVPAGLVWYGWRRRARVVASRAPGA